MDSAHKDDEIKVVGKGGVYWLPNLLTTAALFAAFYSIVAALKGRFDAAATAIFVSMLMDMLDGRVARITHSESPFGAEFDSLSDMVSFGIAPALIVYSWSLNNLGKIGWLGSFSYVACTALRLARFNVQKSVVEKRYFQGLPSPAAAAVMASMVWVTSQNEIKGSSLDISILIITVLLAGLMISNIRYYSFKDLEFKGRLPFIVGLFNVLIFIAIAFDPPLILLILFSLYAISGVVITLVKRRFARKSRKKLT